MENQDTTLPHAIHEESELSPSKEEAELPVEGADVPQGNPKYITPVKGPPGVSSFLQKRLQKGQKFFDSGDYNVARAKKTGPGGLANANAKQRPFPLLLSPPTALDASGQPMPVLTPEDLPHHTHPHEPSKLVNNQINPTA